MTKQNLVVVSVSHLVVGELGALNRADLIQKIRELETEFKQQKIYYKNFDQYV